jgi:hypothetical protein
MGEKRAPSTATLKSFTKLFFLKKYLKIEKNAVNVVVRLGSAGGSTDYDE